jgi:cell division protein FtsA
VVKRGFGHCLQLTLPAEAQVTLTPMGYDEPVNVPQRYLAEIIGPRAREMAQLIGAQIEMAGPPSLFSGGVVLTGGGALLRGFGEMVQSVTDLPARVAAPTGVSGMNDEIQGPDHSTVVGLLRWAARSGGRPPARRLSGGNGHVHLVGRPQPHVTTQSQAQAGDPVGARLGRWIRELF